MKNETDKCFCSKKDYTNRKTESKYSLSERNEKQTKKH